MKSRQLSHRNPIDHGWRLLRGVVTVLMIVCFAIIGVGSGVATSAGIVIGGAESSDEEVQSQSEGRLLLQYRSRARVSCQVASNFVPAATHTISADTHCPAPESPRAHIAIHMIGAGISILC